MLHRIRLAMQDEDGGKLGGSGSPVQADETFIGGKARNMHKIKRAKTALSATIKSLLLVFLRLRQSKDSDCRESFDAHFAHSG
jgi:hypothetical protein